MIFNPLHWIYLAGQWKQGHAKRHKDPTPRTQRHIEWVANSSPVVYPLYASPVLCLGPRNAVELDLLVNAGYSGVHGLDLFSSSDRITVGDMHQIPFADDEFRMVWASHVLEHARRPHQVFAEIFRVLRPGGYLFAAWPTGFQINWHDRVDYRQPIDMKRNQMLPARLLKSKYVKAGESAEWMALFQVPA
jgi:SAM-dependent methyltransferase